MSSPKAKAVLKIKQLNICENINLFKDLIGEYCMSHIMLSIELETAVPIQHGDNLTSCIKYCIFTLSQWS